jgi:hypothetical protein
MRIVYSVKGYAKLRKRISKTDILVFRNSSKGIKNSRPCSECLETMKKLGIRRVYYSLDTGEIVYEKVSNMISTHRTTMTRHIAGEF